MARFVSILFAFSALPCLLSAAAPDFKSQIQPIFKNRCYECHGEAKQKSGLRLDSKPSVFGENDSAKPMLIPGKPAESAIFSRITAEDEDEVMPPKGDRLSKSEIDLLRAWISAGATWPEEKKEQKTHWAYLPPVRPIIPPATATIKLARQEVAKPKSLHPIDAFIRARLAKEGLKPSPVADKSTLLRRLSLDLTGLPPKPGELEAFLNDNSPGAYERAVDRLLASPHYGEKWSQLWLDLARYADTQGYEKDNRRTIWPYRDWVIKALNADMPFDQFTIEQIAGDLLPNATRDQKVATGFHRNTMTNTEGGTDNEEFRHEAIVDRINTTMTVWMGTTFACAQCHNHKYDPFTMKEYYQLYATLNHTADADNDDERPILKLPSPEQESEMARLKSQIKKAEAALNKITPEFTKNLEIWAAKTRIELTNWSFLTNLKPTSKGGATLTLTNHAILASGLNPSNDVYEIEITSGMKQVLGLKLEVLPDPSLPNKSLGRHPNGSFVLTGFEVQAAPLDGSAEPIALNFHRATADFSQDGHSITNLLDPKNKKGWAVGAAEPKNRVERAAYFYVTNAPTFSSGTKLIVTLRHDSPFEQANLGKFRLSATELPDAPLTPTLPEKALKALLAKEPTDKDRTELAAHYRTLAPELKPQRDKLAELTKSRDRLDANIPISSVMEELPKPRDTFMLIRGGFLSKGDKVQPATPAILHKTEFPTNVSPRLQLAKWLASTNNPLSARVMMNRIWEAYFGIGIVETSEDFGTQGEKPLHPELLEWLALEFMNRGWSLKEMHRVIVTSAAYKQSSKATPEILAKDPYNRFLARAPRLRLDAETIRDQALAVAGLLSPKIGGPSVMPPQPDGVWQVVYSSDKWETSKAEDKYRRGLYTFWRRSSPYPSMITFDAPSREFCVVKRSRSNTPLQALTLLNDPVYVEAAQALAKRIITETPSARANSPLPSAGWERTKVRANQKPTSSKHTCCSTSPLDKTLATAQIAYAYKLALGRKPTQAEIARLLKVYEEEHEYFTNNKESAAKLSNAPKDSDPVEHAVWTVISNILLNLDELVSRT